MAVQKSWCMTALNKHVVQKQIAAMLKMGEDEIRVDMQLHADTCDYGLFAVATAAALVHGIHPGECTFNQLGMRRHLYDSLIKYSIPSTEAQTSQREDEVL